MDVVFGGSATDRQERSPGKATLFVLAARFETFHRWQMEEVGVELLLLGLRVRRGRVRRGLGDCRVRGAGRVHGGVGGEGQYWAGKGVFRGRTTRFPREVVVWRQSWRNGTGGGVLRITSAKGCTLVGGAYTCIRAVQFRCIPKHFLLVGRALERLKCRDGFCTSRRFAWLIFKPRQPVCNRQREF